MLLDIDRTALLNAVMPRDLLNRGGHPSGHDQHQLMEDAFLIVAGVGFDQLQLDEIQIKKSTAYSVRSTPHIVVLRCLNRIVKDAASIRPADRDTIIRRLVTVLSEGVPHRLYKFDIRAFFDNLDTKWLLEELANERRMPRSAALILGNFLNHLTSRGIRGLPRGIQLSATLAEYAMAAFDAHVSRLPEVYYYARYVDDIILVTSARENPRRFTKQIRRNLPFGLEFNNSKTRLLDLPVQPHLHGTSIIGDFDYLGYNIAVHDAQRVDRRLRRSIDVTIAKKKVKRLKTRITCAFFNFIATRDASMLERRLKLLTGNYNLRDATTGQLRNAGLYCNYRRVNSTAALNELDAFLRSILLGSRSSLSIRLAAIMPIAERKALLRFSFVRTFNQRTFYNFSTYELMTLTACWQNA